MSDNAALQKGYLVMLDDDLDYFTESKHMAAAHKLAIHSALGDGAKIQTFVCYDAELDLQAQNETMAKMGDQLSAELQTANTELADLRAKVAEVRKWTLKAMRDDTWDYSPDLASLLAILDRDQKESESE